MNEKSPKISIILPTYNGSEYIQQSIESCLNQTYKKIELIIIDDGSTDSTSQIVNSFKDDRIKYYKHDKNYGLPTALNTGFSKITGDYVTWTSDDNYYAEKALEKMLSYLITNDCLFVYCNYYKFSSDNTYKLKIVYLDEETELKKYNCIGPCFLYSKEVKEKIGNYDARFYLAEDYDYWIRISKKYKMHHINEPLYYFRVHSKSLTQSRYNEVKTVVILLKLNHELINEDSALKMLININYSSNSFLKIKRYMYNLQNQKSLAENIKQILQMYEKGDWDLIKTKLELVNLLENSK